MSRCGKTHLLEGAVLGEQPDDALRAHALSCARCRHELNWLETERRLFRERAAREEVQQLWTGVAQRTGRDAGRSVVNRALLGAAAVLLLLLGVSRVWLSATSHSGADASLLIAEASPDVERALVTENAFTVGPQALCSKPGGDIGFHCGYSTVLASR